MTPAPVDEAALERDGFALSRSLVPSNRVETARRATSADEFAGLRDPLARAPVFRDIAESRAVRLIAQHVLGRSANLVRAILFDKTPSMNWPVAPHRDTTIAVERRAEVPGFGPWSEKDGVPHCRPPRGILESMLTIRIALDGADDESGALRVIPGSHRADSAPGLPPMTDPRWRTCRTESGDAVLMRPLLVHASKRAVSPSRRRVLHLEWAGEDLPAPLRWRHP
jgi:ectoine hydroxylase-related dioxygenase (phytanoyl-CoA dioxygenase family)